jgi:hypothetical protein
MVRMVDHDLQLFPTYEKLELIQGGGTVQTYQMPPWATRCQMIFTTEGRPLKAEAQLWLGPLRTVHTLQMDVEDGQRTPVQATLKFKQSAQVLRIQTSDSVEFPILAGVYVPSPDRAKEINDITENLFENALPHQKLKVQGGSTKGGGGATRDWIIPAHVESVQLIAWSKDVGKKIAQDHRRNIAGTEQSQAELLLAVRARIAAVPRGLPNPRRRMRRARQEQKIRRRRIGRIVRLAVRSLRRRRYRRRRARDYRHGRRRSRETQAVSLSPPHRARAHTYKNSGRQRARKEATKKN